MKLLQLAVYSPGETLKDNIMEVGILAIRQLLKEYYTAHHRMNPLKPQSRIGRLTVNMLGPAEDPNLHAKGGETRGVTGFVLQQLMLHAAKLDEGGRRHRRFNKCGWRKRICNIHILLVCICTCCGGECTCIHPYRAVQICISPNTLRIHIPYVCPIHLAELIKLCVCVCWLLFCFYKQAYRCWHRA